MSWTESIWDTYKVNHLKLFLGTVKSIGQVLDWLCSFVSDEQNDHQNTLSYVLINPSHDTRLEINDIV